jgi:hypothetical protein
MKGQCKTLDITMYIKSVPFLISIWAPGGWGAGVAAAGSPLYIT